MAKSKKGKKDKAKGRSVPVPGSPKSGASTAFEMELKLADVERLMARQQWDRSNRLELARKYGVTVQTVNGWGRAIHQHRIKVFSEATESGIVPKVRAMADIASFKALMYAMYERSEGKASGAAQALVKLLELELRVQGVGADIAQHTQVNVTTMVAGASVQEHARAVIQAFPAACAALGIPLTPELQSLPLRLEQLVDGTDLLERVVIEAAP